MSAPLISCLMPTFNRRAFVPRAIEYFQRQDYENRELVILDDGSDSIADLVPDDPRIRYERLSVRTVLGRKRNLSCQTARGDVLVHWDDDDWFAPWRLSYQVSELQRTNADVCGLSQLLFFEPASLRAFRYVFPRSRRPWVCGGSCCFTRAFWKRNPFPEIAIGEDTRFVLGSRSARIVAHPNSDFYVALIHPHNTSQKRTRDSRYRPVPLDEVRRLLGDDVIHPALNPTRNAPMKLNLGCCDSVLPDHVNVDSIPGPGVMVADLTEPWPWSDGSVDSIRAWDIVEHLPDKVHTMNEMWRVLRAGGTTEIAVPTTDGPGAFQDPTHVSFWNRRSFLYYEANNPYRERFARSYGIRARFRVVRERVDVSADGPRLTIVLQAVKS